MAKDKTYTVKCGCTNCGNVEDYTIVLGVAVKQCKCSMCGCYELFRVPLSNGPTLKEMMEDDEDGADELIEEAERIVREAGKASTSYLQRKMGVGYARAAMLMDTLESKGVVGAADGAKPREVIPEGGKTAGITITPKNVQKVFGDAKKKLDRQNRGSK